jgi:hypothetical protein
LVKKKGVPPQQQKKVTNFGRLKRLDDTLQIPPQSQPTTLKTSVRPALKIEVWGEAGAGRAERPFQHSSSKAFSTPKGNKKMET